MSSSSSITLASWAGILRTEDRAQGLEAITRYTLGSYEQHIEAVRTPGVVPAVVQCLSSRRQDTTPPDTQQALLALKAFSISRMGQQALVAAGAHDAICDVLQQLLVSTQSSNGSTSVCDCYEQPAKRTRFEDEPGAPPDVLVPGVFQDATQLLADLLLQSPAKPAIGSLVHSVKAFSAMQQAMSGVLWHSWPPALLQDAAGVLARLAMEPAVEPRLLCNSSYYMLQPSATSGASASGCASCAGTSRFGEAFSALLGSSEAAADFFSNVWEADSVHYSSNTISSMPNQLSITGSRAGCHECGKRQQLQQHQSQQGLLTEADGMASSARACLGQLLQELTVAALFCQVLPTAWHCPVIGVSETDALQHLQELRLSGQLLQPLQHNLDVRLIRAVQAPSEAAAHFQDFTGHSSQCPPLQQQCQDATTEQLLAFESHVTVESIATACKMQQPSGASGFSLVLRDVPKRVKAVAQLVNSIEQQLGLPAGANLYHTPPGAQGLKLHYDDHCVFVLQLQGCKSWLVAPPQHQHLQLPLTYQPRIPVALPIVQGDHQQQQEPLPPPPQQVDPRPAEVRTKTQEQQQLIQQHLLLPGDVLYIPRGWVHQARTPDKQAAAMSAACRADASASGAIHSDVAALPVQDGERAPTVIGPAQTAAADFADGSLHLSIGVEVEPRFSVQGYLHCLLEYACRSVSISECQQYSSDCHRHAAADSCESVLSAAAHQAVAAIRSGVDRGAQPLTAKEGLPGISCGSLSAAAESTAAQRLAACAAGTLLHILLWQHASQHAELRRACPILINSTDFKAAANARLLRQLGCNTNSTALEVSATAKQQHGGKCIKQITSEQHKPQATKLQVLSSAEQHWIDLALQQAFCPFNSHSNSRARTSMDKQPPSGQRDCTLAAHSLLQSGDGQGSTLQQAPAQPGARSPAAFGAAADAGADEQAAEQLLLRLDAELLSGIYQEVQAAHQQALPGAEAGSEAEVATASTSAMKMHSVPDATPNQLPGTPGVLEWIETAQAPAGVATAAAVGVVNQDAWRHVQACQAGAVSEATELMGTGLTPSDACTKPFNVCNVCKDMYSSCSCMLFVLQVLAVAAEAHAVKHGEWNQSAQLKAATPPRNSSRTGCMDPEAEAMHFQTNATAIGSEQNSDWAAPVLDAVVHLPHALQLMLQVLNCHKCREHAAAGLVQAACYSLGARKAVRHAHVAVHSVKHVG